MPWGASGHEGAPSDGGSSVSDLTTADITDDLVPLAAELIGCVRDYGPDAVAGVLARVPEGRHDALAVVLAAMVDPDARPTELLAWANGGPVKSRDFGPPARGIHALTPKELGRRADRRLEVARLSALRVPVSEIALRLGISERSVVRHRTAIRNALPDEERGAA